MNVLKKLALTTVATVSLSAISNVALADNLFADNKRTTLTSDSLATFINNLPQERTTSISGSALSSNLATTSLASTSFGTTAPTVYFPTQTSNSTQPSFMNGKVQSLIAKAKNFIGLPYRYGGTSPTSGFDCSGFMQYIYKQTAGINLPRRSQDMAASGRSISRNDLQAGDMVFFKTGGAGISHVGMYIGDNKFIHAPRTGKSIEISNLNNGYYAKTFATARRVLSQEA